MLTFPKIYSKISESRRKAASLVKIDKPRTGIEKRTGYRYFMAWTSSPKKIDPKTGRVVVNKNKERYLTMVYLLDNNNHIKLSCSCPDYLFRHEVALFTNDASDVIYSNGDYPKATNPLLEPSCCKHCLALYMLLYKHGFVE